jgi:cellulose synthase/poly-beta-1,6-N-acetylglucosamine synthase-like glycosyltransferase
VAIAALAAALFIPLAAWTLLGMMWPSEGGVLGYARSAAGTTLSLVFLVTGCRWVTVLVLAWRGARTHVPRQALDTSLWPRVSVLVPAYNEAETIDAALSGLLSLDYPDLEVVVVDDGSTDATWRLAKRFEGEQPGRIVRVVKKANGGKWSALNLALRHATGPFVLCVDADSRLEPDALRLLVPHMKNPHLGAVAGQIRVRNRDGLLTWLQALEYVIANGARLAQGLHDRVLLVPGPIGLFRRDVLREIERRFSPPDVSGPGAVAGPWQDDTFAEDFDLSLAVHALGFGIAYEPLAISRTRAPAWSGALLNQRYRWVRGSYQAVRKYLHRRRNGRASHDSATLTWICATYLLDLAVLPLGYGLTLFLLLTHIPDSAEAARLAGYLAAYFIVNLNAAAFLVSAQRDGVAVLRTLPILDLYQGLVLGGGWMLAVWDELRGRAMRW